MQGGYYSATGGMVAQFNKLDSTANNLANLNSAGYKKDELIFGDYLRIYQEKRDLLPIENHTVEGSKFYNRTMNRVPQVVDQYTDFTLGNIQKTFGKFDIALSDPHLFFVVDTPSGKRLTRNGAFTTDAEGYLVTKEGFKVMDSSLRPIQVDLKSEISFDRDGNYKNGANIGTIMVYQPEDLRLLKKEGSSLFKLENNNENIRFTHKDGTGSVRQGFLELSNVNAVIEMTKLIEANRMVGMYQKVMDTHMNELNRDAIEKIGATKA